MKWAVLALLVAGCYRDEEPVAPRGSERERPPVARTMAQLPLIDQRDTDEYVLFDKVRAVFAAAGFADEAKKIELLVDDHVMVPYAQLGAVVARHFLADGPAVREHVATISHWLYRDRLPDNFAFADYRAFMTALVCNAFAEAVAHARAKAGMTGAWAEQTRAIRFERACVADLVRAKAVPADTLAAYARFDRVLAAADPATPAMSEALFDGAYVEIEDAGALDPSRPHRKAVQIEIVLAMLAQYRADQEAAPVVELAAVAPELLQ